MSVTYIETTNPARIGKIYGPDGAGGVTKSVEMTYRAAVGVRCSFPNLQELGEFVDAMESGTSYLIAGVCDGPETFDITGIDDEEGIKKGKEQFPFPAGPGVMIIDADNAIPAEDLRFQLDMAAPGFGHVAMEWKPSSSSYLWNGDEQFTGLKGAHAFVSVADASDIPRAGDVLFKRLWLAGFGWIKTSSAGAMLERAPYDRAMLVGSQPCFAAGAFCEPPVRQERPPALYLPGAEEVDTQVLLPDLTPQEEQAFRKLVAAAKRKAAPEAKKIREGYIDGRVVKVLKQRLERDPTPEEVGQFDRSTLDIPIAGGTLGMDQIVELQSGLLVTVEEILLQPARYHRQICRDPASPEYLAGILFTDRGRPVLHSEANVKPTWKLGSDADRKALAADRGHMAAILKNLREMSPHRRSLLIDHLRGT
ncbi:hypothetical protein [Aliiruegeria sabulilitoris]|uniref:hypothetical protein n=1 Tax=Aliiruegeria sabulilitoris TaxID=1510458 RepID=UPI00082FC08F|nr:hypothetical protein [Aliiruegeria sabulilitoris]NDR57392.1 hypothetical protein [Pseudoruegeria sp. M32A2M]